MRTTFSQPAPDGSEFAADAFDAQIGKEIPVNMGQSTRVLGRVLSAAVAPDGRSVEIDIDIPGVPEPTYPAGSFGFADRQ
jgi:hypothetical protein